MENERDNVIGALKYVADLSMRVRGEVRYRWLMVKQRSPVVGYRLSADVMRAS